MGKKRSTKTLRKDRRLSNKPRRYTKLETIDYRDIETLQRFITERGKLRSRRITGLSRQQQSEVAVAVKRARELSLLPYIGTGLSKRRERGEGR